MSPTEVAGGYPGPVLLSNGHWAHQRKPRWWKVSTDEAGKDPLPPYCGPSLAACENWAVQNPRPPKV